ncbi:aminopeptidase P family protein [Acholeplasma granularum]|uniref:aminopeptidase P family protein n=1 Tax=Acholeplasma granularum TaxID=264635 RepID=UPI0004B87BDC|nr:aminopeptidase P family protein [Acholeplasma granularum]
MYKNRRNNYIKLVDNFSLSLFYSGSAPHLSNDAYYPFQVNKNFWYLSNISQSDSILMIVKANDIETSYLFIKKIDPIEALWVGESLTFEKASHISGIPLENIVDISNFDSFFSNLFTQTRRALFGQIKSVYFDIERQSIKDAPLKGELEAKLFNQRYPHIQIKNAHGLLANLRSSKDELEVEYTKKAIEVSRLANLRLLDTIKYANNESDLLAEFNYILNKNQTKPSFNEIIASGKNATILHYEDNNQPINKNDLVLLDLGVRFNQYASDITRTYPASGKFNKRQKEVYQAVLNVNKAIINWVKPGVTQFEYNQKGKELLTIEAKKLGLITKDEDIIKYYYHGLGHPLGLDVHDVGNPSLPFKVGQIITVEPGLYIAEEGIGVRIEDDLLLTEDGCINLSESIIKEVKDIELYLEKV